MKSSFHNWILFLPLFCNFQFRRLDSIQFLCSQAHIPAGWRPRTRLFSSVSTVYSATHSTRLLLYSNWSCLLTVSFYKPSARTTQKTRPLLLTRRWPRWPRRCLTIDIHLLHAYASQECLPCRCLAMGTHATQWNVCHSVAGSSPHKESYPLLIRTTNRLSELKLVLMSGACVSFTTKLLCL
jgi:hypothetical protein